MLNNEGTLTKRMNDCRAYSDTITINASTTRRSRPTDHDHIALRHGGGVHQADGRAQAGRAGT